MVRLALLSAALLIGIFSSGATAQPLDQYGGYVDLPVPGGATGVFRVEKMNNRWVFVSPAGNAFWMRGVFNVSPDTSIDDMGDSYYNRVIRKYGTIDTWGTQTALRLKAWGFTAVSEYSDWRVWGKIPSVQILNTSSYALTNRWNLAPGATKELISGTDPTVYSGYRGGTTPDVFDPNFAAYVDAFVAQDYPGIRSLFGTPYLLGISTDDRDYLFGFGPGPEIPSSITHPHLGWLVLVGASQRSSWGTTTYGDATVYAKRAFRDMLQTKYGTIQALNTAWGSHYTTFDSAGGWGAGTGLLDEKGLNSWVGRDFVSLSDVTPALRADLDEYLYRHAKQYFSVMTSTIRKYAPNHLIFGPATLNSDGLTRRQILQAAGEAVDVVQASIDSQAALNLTAQYTGNRPIVTWEGVIANPDSAFFRNPQPVVSWALPTQTERGKAYADAVTARLSFKDSTGFYPIAGIGYWEFHDNWREKNSWGLVTLSDNAYNGTEAVVTAGVDPWGYRTGGEERNYGDFMTSAVSAHGAILTALKGTTTTPLSVSIISPSEFSTVSQMLDVTAAASTNATQIELSLDGNLVTAVPSSTAKYTWDTRSTTNGTHRWVARARDINGTLISSTPVDVVVNNTTADPFTVTLTQPVGGAIVPRKTRLTIAASTVKSGPIVKVEFYVQNSLQCTDTTASYTCLWQVPAASGRTYRLQAKAYGADGAVAISNTVTIFAK